jgi:hypothetical protein
MSHDANGRGAAAPRPNRTSVGGALTAAATTTIIIAATAACSASTTSSPNANTTSSLATSTAASRDATSTSSAPLPTVAPNRLDALLLTGPEAETVMGAGTLSPRTAVFHELDGARTASPPDCLGARWPAQKSAYQGSGYTAISLLELDPEAKTDTYVQQAIATFPSQDQALAFVTKSAEAWKACAGQNIVATGGSDTLRWTFGDVSGEPPKIAVLLTQEAGRGLACQHALSAVSNIVIDINTCGYQIGGQAGELVDLVATKVTQ